jgi:MraZ protein
VSILAGFIGNYELTIDDKGRLTIPARFKQVLQENYPEDQMQVVISLGFDKNLLVEPPSVRQKRLKKYQGLSETDDAARRVRDRLMWRCAEEKVDGSGRIRLTSKLREDAAMKREIVCIGCEDSFKLWDTEILERRMAETMEMQEDLLKQVEEQIRIKN